MATLWDTLQLFSIPLYGICLITFIELLKYVGAFRSLQDLELISGNLAKNLQDQKRLAILVIGALLASLFFFFQDPSDQFRYFIKLVITYALATTCYENIIKFLKKAWLKYRKKK